MSVHTTCHTDALLTFPKECVRCGKPPRNILTIIAGRTVDLLITEFGTEIDVTVPLCRSCWLQRKICGFVIGLVILVAVMGIGMALVHDSPKAFRLLFVALLLASTGATMLYIRNWHSRLMDRLFAGVSAGRLQRDGTYSLWLKRSELAEELTYQEEPRNYIEGSSWATHEERNQQMFASWWFKCVGGVLLLLAAVFMFHELSEMEAGNRRGAGIPDILIAIHSLVGKWPICLTFGGLGLAAFGIGVYQLVDPDR